MSEALGDESRRHVVLSGDSRGLWRSLVEGHLKAGYRASTFSRNSTEFVEQARSDPSSDF
jgi:hypothetical protein